MCAIATSFTPTHPIHKFGNVFAVPASTNPMSNISAIILDMFSKCCPSLDEPHVAGSEDSENAYHLESPK
jgi:hypothetical protein